jgi:hypothetical protein
VNPRCAGGQVPVNPGGPHGAPSGRASGAVLAKSEDQAAGLFQNRAFRVPGMNRRRHIGSTNVVPLREVSRIRAFIEDLDRRAQLLDHDIAAYPGRATSLTACRDNLRGTIAALEKQLAGLQGRANNRSLSVEHQDVADHHTAGNR